EKVQTAFGNVFATRNRDDPGKVTLVVAVNHLPIGLRRDQDVTIGQNKRRNTDELSPQLGCFSRAVLDHLPSESNARFPARTIAEIILDRFGAEAGDDEDIPDSSSDEAFDDVFQDRLAIDR